MSNKRKERLISCPTHGTSRTTEVGCEDCLNDKGVKYEPERWWILKDSIYAAQRAIKIGMEHMDDSIDRLEKAEIIDRTERVYLEIMREEKRLCEKALAGLKPHSGEEGAQ